MAETESGIKKATRPKKRPAEPEASVSASPSEGLGESNETQAGTETLGADALLGTATEEPRRGRGRPPGSTKPKVVEMPSTPEVTVSAKEAGVVIDAIGAFKVWMAGRLGYPPEIAAVLAYESQERDYLAEPTAVILSKWLPKTMGRFKDEISLLFAFYVVEQQKLEKLKVLMAARVAQAALMNGAAASERAA